MGRGIGIVGVVLLVALAGACDDGEPSGTTKSAARELQAAAKRTLAERYFKIRMGEVDVKHPQMVTSEYAPGRSQTVTGNDREIQIGRTIYSNEPVDGGAFTRITVPESVPAPSDLRDLLSLALHPRSGVSADGDLYTTTTKVPGSARRTRWEYRVANGRVTDLRIESRVRGKNFNSEFHVFDFGVPNHIEAPVGVPIEDSVPPPPCPPATEPSAPPVMGACLITADR